MTQVYKTRFTEPYKENKSGKMVSNLPILSPEEKQSGVYLIQSKRSGKIVYVGFSETQLYRTVFRHFQKWTDIQRNIKTRFTYSKTGYKVRLILSTPARAASLEKYLILKLQPRDNAIKYETYQTAAQQTTCEKLLNSSVSISVNKDYPF